MRTRDLFIGCLLSACLGLAGFALHYALVSTLLAPALDSRLHALLALP
jgi:hypothetical protein